MKREDEFEEELNKLINDPTMPLVNQSDVLKKFYLGYIAASLAVIADELHEMNEAKILREELQVAKGMLCAQNIDILSSMYPYPKEENKNECTDSACE